MNEIIASPQTEQAATASRLQMKSQTVRNFYAVSLLLLDGLAIFLAFLTAYQLRVWIPWPAEVANLQPFVQYIGLLVALIVAILGTLAVNRQYYVPRAVSRIDQLYIVFGSVSIGTMIAIAISVFIFKDTVFEVDFPRAMVIYAWFFGIVYIMTGRALHQYMRNKLRDRGIGKDRLLVVGTGDVARIILQRILWSPHLGYETIGLINGDEPDPGDRPVDAILGIPVIGRVEDLPDLIDRYQVDEVIIAVPEKGHREAVHIISYCERGRVSIKIFPDIFQFVTTDAGIDDLGGLPLLTVRDFALRGYFLILKRLMDFFGALFGLVFFSPLMLMVAVAIKLESPGPAFFIQERMGLDGKPFRMIKFRSMRSDAEKYGPGWTIDDDPRQTRIGKFLRKIEVDELPNLVNVLIGEMSLVGPRPEQPYYVEEFRKTVPRYMERHREKAGMTGWAQVNGLRGDTSITERTKYDLWYTENWSILLDIKIILRTIWQIFAAGKNQPDD